jgi:hypothetical protein
VNQLKIGKSNDTDRRQPAQVDTGCHHETPGQPLSATVVTVRDHSSDAADGGGVGETDEL